MLAMPCEGCLKVHLNDMGIFSDDIAKLVANSPDRASLSVHSEDVRDIMLEAVQDIKFHILNDMAAGNFARPCTCQTRLYPAAVQGELKATLSERDTQSRSAAAAAAADSGPPPANKHTPPISQISGMRFFLWRLRIFWKTNRQLTGGSGGGTREKRKESVIEMASYSAGMKIDLNESQSHKARTGLDVGVGAGDFLDDRVAARCA